MKHNFSYTDLNNHYQSIIESESAAIITSDSSKCIRSWNKGAEKIFGFSENEIIGKPITVIIPKIYHDKHDEGMSRLNSGKKPRLIGNEIEIIGLKKDKTEFPVELTLGYWSNKGVNYYSAVIRDISKKKEIESIVRKQNKQFQVISTSKNDAIITSDESKRILFWNKGAEHIFGYTSEEVVNQPITMIIPPQLQEAHKKGMDRMNRGGKPSVIGEVVELTGIKKDGEVIPIELALGTWENDGKIYYSAIIRDITERKKSEEIIKNQNEEILKEKEKSDHLLLNILPVEIAEELKEKGMADVHAFDKVSILFTDFVGFTKAAGKMSAHELVAELNVCFEAFDLICEKYHVEKIKTIGDAYMAVGGLPIPTDDSVENTVLAALEMQAFIINRKKQKEETGEQAFDMRAGIHTGEVVAGIVGIKKFQYDIWGDAVNTASRMESHGQVGKVNVSQITYELLKDDSQLIFEHRGKLKVKGKGEVYMYFVGLA
ncbi:MAG: PAS domain S-box protein [Bacteroidetes bacterium]|nr:PAS domain S-box protein [Bacteroidota bacterium]